MKSDSAALYLWLVPPMQMFMLIPSSPIALTMAGCERQRLGSSGKRDLSKADNASAEDNIIS